MGKPKRTQETVTGIPWDISHQGDARHGVNHDGVDKGARLIAVELQLKCPSLVRMKPSERKEADPCGKCDRCVAARWIENLAAEVRTLRNEKGFWK